MGEAIAAHFAVQEALLLDFHRIIFSASRFPCRYQHRNSDLRTIEHIINEARVLMETWNWRLTRVRQTANARSGSSVETFLVLV